MSGATEITHMGDTKVFNANAAAAAHDGIDASQQNAAGQAWISLSNEPTPVSVATLERGAAGQREATMLDPDPDADLRIEVELAIDAADDVRPSSSAVDDAVSSSAAPTVATRRQALLADFNFARGRKIACGRIVAAVKLRCAAQVFCDKSEVSRLLPRYRLASNRQNVEALLNTNVDELIADIEANPGKYSRTLIHDVATRHFSAGLNYDKSSFEQGLRKAAPYEGLHSVASRACTSTAALLTFGATQLIPGAGAALSQGLATVAKAARSTVKFLGREAPASVANPIISGSLRRITDVKETLLRTGGQPRLAPAIAKSLDMGRIGDEINGREAALHAANEAFEAALAQGADLAAPLRALVVAFLKLYDAADMQYKRRIGANRSQSYSKAYGAAVNGVAASAALVSVGVPGLGQVVGPVLQAACIPLQAGAGYLDHMTTHHYNLRANTKWADVLTEQGRRMNFRDLTIDHIDEQAARNAFALHAELAIAAIQEAYREELGTLIGEHVRLAGKPAPQQDGVRLGELEASIAARKADAALFETFNADQWDLLPPEGTIGRCVDDPKFLERAAIAARKKKAGELGAQIMQRYAQGLHAGISSGISLPASDALTILDDATHGDHHALSLGLGAVGGTAFTATTFEVRMSKTDNKTRLSSPTGLDDPARKAQFDADAQAWTFQAGGKTIDLRSTGAYDRHFHTRAQRYGRVMRALVPSLASGPKGAFDLAWAKHYRLHAKQSMLRAIELLEQAACTDTRAGEGAPARAATLSALKDRLLDFEEVRALVAEPGLLS